MKLPKIKVFTFLLALLVLAEAIAGVIYLKESLAVQNKASLQALRPSSQRTVLFLDPAAKEALVGEKLPVAVVLNTGGRPATGVDLILRFDAQQMTAVEIIPGQAFDFYPQKKIKEGEILISAVNQDGRNFSGQGILAQIIIQGKKRGSAKLTIEFQPGQTTDTNVAMARSGQDGLEEVQGGLYTFN